MRLVRNPDNGKVRYLEATEAEMWEADSMLVGICLKCGEIEEGRCEPDAAGYECSSCGAKSLISLTMLALHGRVKFID